MAPEEHTRLGIASEASVMGIGALVGEKVPDRQHKLRIVIGPDWLRDGAIVVDAGYHPGGVGDIELTPALDRIAAYTPVPGGVGPMTINTLIYQCVDAGERKISQDYD